jgi:muramoyltetrapeptide carboxypeptidase
MLQDSAIDLILPPWGGELLIEVLEYVDFERIAPKWIMGYSDISLLLLAVTLKTGIATAHGSNLLDLRGERTDRATAMWQKVLSTSEGESILQQSSPAYQKQWPDRSKSSKVFDITEPTRWQTVGEGPVASGRLVICLHGYSCRAPTTLGRSEADCGKPYTSAASRRQRTADRGELAHLHLGSQTIMSSRQV